MLQPEVTQKLEQVAQLIFVPTNEEELDQLIRLLDDLIDIVRDDETHPLANTMDVLGVLIEAYEREHIPEPPENAVEILKHFIQEYDLDESDLPEIGSRADVLAILHGLQPLTPSHATALAKRFDVSEIVFLERVPQMA